MGYTEMLPHTPVENPVGLTGIDFVEFTSPQPEALHQLFTAFGFSKIRRHKTLAIDYYNQNDIHFLVNQAPNGFAKHFQQAHGPSISAMGFRVENAQKAFETAVARGAKPYQTDLDIQADHSLPAIYGIGDSLIYFVDRYTPGNSYFDTDFTPLDAPVLSPEKGFLYVDHLTNNVPDGTRDTWVHFYQHVFGFTEIRYFDIQGKKTGLTSYALRSPCGSFAIPINEAKDEKSQIAEYLRDYNGAGIQHLAFASKNLLDSLDRLAGSGIETLDIDPSYYQEAYLRVPTLKEDKTRIEQHKVLVDGDENGYLLQIFTKNLVGPIFIEMIQRENNLSFGEGNFGALFRSIERDQERRGVL